MNGSLQVTDLAAGEYLVWFQTKPKADLVPIPGSATTWSDAINPGMFLDRRAVRVAPGDVQSVSFHFQPFDADAWKGDQDAEIKVLLQDGSLAIGRQAKIAFYDGHFGALTVFEGPVPEDGLLRLKGISGNYWPEVPFGPYSLDLDDKRLGFFRVAGAGPHTFEFRITPAVGDMAPDIELTELNSRTTSRLHDHRGKVVMLEFWATWCGPCQPAMEKLNEMVRTSGAEWQDDVVFIPLSADTNADFAARHVAKSGWTSLAHFWAGGHKGGYASPAQLAYGVDGIPQAILVGRDGRILWRGHPDSRTDGESVDARIRDALIAK